MLDGLHWGIYVDVIAIVHKCMLLLLIVVLLINLVHVDVVVGSVVFCIV